MVKPLGRVKLGSAEWAKAKLAMKKAGMSALTGPLEMTIRATYEIPRSWSAAKRAATEWKSSRGDIDNVAKQICDALNRIAWTDDCQIAEMRVRKVWGLLDQTVVHVEAMDAQEFTD